MKQVNLDYEFYQSEAKARADFYEIAEIVYLCKLNGKTAATFDSLTAAKEFKANNKDAEVLTVKRLKGDHSKIFEEAALYSSFETI